MGLHKNIIRLTLFLSIISWVLLLTSDLFVLFGEINNVQVGIPKVLRLFLLGAFFASVFYYFRFVTARAERVNFINLLWRAFVTGLLATLLSLVIRFFFEILIGERLPESVFLVSLFFHIRMGLFTVFLLSTVMVWKQLILYHRSKQLNMLWRIFEYALFVGIVTEFLPLDRFGPVYLFVLITLLALALVLSINLKWVAYLDFRQKWKSILIILGIGIFTIYYTMELYFSIDVSQQIGQAFLLLNPFLLAAIGFALVYSLFSILVLLFNLPTSSVFEQKLEEVVNFQRLSQSTQAGYKIEQVYEILLESAVKAVGADVGWVEVNDLSTPLLLTKNMAPDKVAQLKPQLQIPAETVGIINPLPGPPRLRPKDPVSRKNRHRMLKLPEYHSVLWIPLVVKGENMGTLVLLKEVMDGFNQETVNIVSTFANQACISAENLQLLTQTVENERYREELKIANRVHRSLLPKETISNHDFEVVAFSEAADLVGGDYYDFYQINEHKYIIIIGDVSGKGTSAAFNMSQMKGVFHSLAQLDLSPDKFLAHANSALGRCLEKTSFITASFFVVDTRQRTIEFARAGHTPTLYYSACEKKADFIQIKGLGLGIIRNDNFNSYIEVNKRKYCDGDVIVLYTDGITEASSADNEEYGYDRLRCAIEQNAGQTPQHIQENLMQDLYTFCQNRPINDDYTALIVKFKPKLSTVDAV